MNVGNIMTAQPVTIGHTRTLRAALRKMDEHGFHHLPVLSRDNHLVGIITADDCRLALDLPQLLDWEQAAAADTITVREVMTAAPTIVEPNTPAIEATRLMLENHLSCVPVMRGETLVGIITTSDILVAFMILSKREMTPRLP